MAGSAPRPPQDHDARGHPPDVGEGVEQPLPETAGRAEQTQRPGEHQHLAARLILGYYRYEPSGVEPDADGKILFRVHGIRISAPEAREDFDVVRLRVEIVRLNVIKFPALFAESGNIS